MIYIYLLIRRLSGGSGVAAHTSLVPRYTSGWSQELKSLIAATCHVIRIESTSPALPFLLLLNHSVPLLRRPLPPDPVDTERN